MENKQNYIELNAYEVAAFWFVRRIKAVADEVNSGVDIYGEGKLNFAEIFDYSVIKNAGYRKIYQELAKRIQKKSEKSYRCMISTHRRNKGHDELIVWLSEIMGRDVPNINIGTHNSPESVLTIITDGKGAKPYAVVGGTDIHHGVVSRLPTRYKPNPIIMGSGRTNKLQEVVETIN